MDDKEFDKRIEEYKKSIKEKSDRSLLESIAIKLKVLELKIEESHEDLIDTHNLIIESNLDIINLINNQKDLLSNPDEIDKEESYDNLISNRLQEQRIKDIEYEQEKKLKELERKQKKQVEKLDLKMKKIDKLQKSFCKECGNKLPESRWSASGYSECQKCRKKYTL